MNRVLAAVLRGVARMERVNMMYRYFEVGIRSGDVTARFVQCHVIVVHDRCRRRDGSAPRRRNDNAIARILRDLAHAAGVIQTGRRVVT